MTRADLRAQGLQWLHGPNRRVPACVGRATRLRVEDGEHVSDRRPADADV